MTAKPIIDTDIIVNRQVFALVKERLAAVGYQYHTSICYSDVNVASMGISGRSTALDKSANLIPENSWGKCNLSKSTRFRFCSVFINEHFETRGS